MGVARRCARLARAIGGFGLCLLVLSGAGSPARAEPCALGLVLAVDISASVSEWEYGLQIRGFANAFRDRGVIDAIEATAPRVIMVTLVHWSGVDEQVRSVDWTPLRDAISSLALAARIEAVERPYNGHERQWMGTGTALGAALRYTSGLFAQSGTACDRRVIDVSGDGRSNVGEPPAAIRDAIVLRGITINGLAILSDEADLDDYFRSDVIGGPGSFVMTASNHQAFAVAIRNKLLREISPRLAMK